MNCLKHGKVRSHIAGGQKTQSADEPAGKIRQNISIQIFCHYYVKGFRMHYQLHGYIINDLILYFNSRIFLADLVKNITEQAVGKLHDIGLMDAGYFFSFVLYRIVKGGSDNALTAFSGNDFNGMGRILINLFFHACIEILCVFSEHYNIHMFKGRLNCSVRLCRAHIGVKIVFFAQRYIQRTEAGS